MENKKDIGLIGLAVMGSNLALNINDHGYSIAVYNRTFEKTEKFLNGEISGRRDVSGAETLEEFVSMLERPRKIILMVKAGEIVDQYISKLSPYLEKGDIIIDGGNSFFTDTERRTADLKDKGILYVGTGISGGEEGARKGPSIMPGGNPEAWPYIKSIFRDIAAKTPEGDICCGWVGENGAGHFVKMVHNGIEYGDMQLISEAYDIMRNGLSMNSSEISDVFKEWNKGDLESYLIEITADILSFRDKDGTFLVDNILDRAGQKGTGKWTGIEAFNLGVPVTIISEAVYMRFLSSMKRERVEASSLFGGTERVKTENRDEFIRMIGEALLASKIISYTQGFMLMKKAAENYAWKLAYGDIALMWRGGCIIRSVFLGKIKDAFEKNPDIDSLLLDEYFMKKLTKCSSSLRTVISESVKSGIPVPSFSAALSFYDGYRSRNLPANLIQAQRDYFGAHTYQRIDSPDGAFIHTDWS